MTQGQMIGAICAAVAVIEVATGFLIVIPKAPEDKRTALTIAIISGAIGTVAIGAAMFFGLIPVGSPAKV